MDNVIIEKIQKLLALATSSNPHEAQLAMDKASALLAKHNLSYADLNQGEKVTMAQARQSAGKRPAIWKQQLFAAVTDVLDCCPILEKSQNGSTFLIVGHQADVIIASNLISSITETIERLSTKIEGSKRTKNSYRLGLVRTIHTRLTDMYKDMKQTLESTTTALVCVDKKARVEAFVNQMGNFKVKRTTRPKADVDAYARGIRDGRNVSLNQELGNNHQAVIGY